MVTEVIAVENMKCGGCVSTIEKKVHSIKGVQEVRVNLEAGTVEVQGDEEMNRTEVIDSLFLMGYPLQGQNGAVEKLKSYVSCAIGRISPN
jgi:copper chaperone